MTVRLAHKEVVQRKCNVLRMMWEKNLSGLVELALQDGLDDATRHRCPSLRSSRESGPCVSAIAIFGGQRLARHRAGVLVGYQIV